MTTSLIERIMRFVRRTGLSNGLSVDQSSDAEIKQKIILLLNAYRRRLIKGAANGKYSKITIRARRRFARRKVSELSRKIRRGKRPVFRGSILLSRYHESPILSALIENRNDKWKAILKRNREAELTLSGFSFLDRPSETLKAFKQIGEFEADMISAKLHFEDIHCVDIAPYLVLSEIWPQMASIFSGGRMRISVQKVVEAVHLRKPLGMKLRVSDRINDVWAFPLRKRRPSGSSKSIDLNLNPQSKEEVADDFCDAVNVWLAEADQGLALTDIGKSIFSNIIGELLDNAERHSDTISNDGSWSIAAFMARRKEGNKSILHCYMGFLSVGASISESLDTASDDIKNDIAKYCKKHINSGISAETLATLVALQDGITRDQAAKSASRGGIGFQDVMEFVSHLGGTSMEEHKPKMTIVSGRSCIKLVDPYFCATRQEESKKRILWCNVSNSPEEPPDQQYVFDLEDRFAGTVIALSFVLDADYLRNLINAGNQPK